MASKPMVVVVGTTGVGKSKLAVELAQSLSDLASSRSSSWTKGRVLNADAMQVYRGLDIVTNKIPADEQCGVEHCLMGFKEPGEQYVVGEWIHEALKVIGESHQHDTLPIVAGGTLYWVQHLIFPDRLVSAHGSEDTEGINPSTSPPSPELASRLQLLPPNLASIYDVLPERDEVAALSEDNAWSLHLLLSHLDPDMGARWHWKDSRKVLRSLEIIKETGRLASQSVRAQDQEASLPRIPTLVFWLYAEPDVLEPRLDARVDTMLESGLMDELVQLRDIASKLPSGTQGGEASDHTDSTTGIFQSIGYKEFGPFLAESPSGLASLNSTSQTFKQGIELMKLSTRQYAKKQVKWTRNRLIPAINAAKEAEGSSPNNDARIYLLDASKLGADWETNVKDKAVSIMHTFLDGKYEDLPDSRSLSPAAARLLGDARSSLAPSATLAARKKRICTTCTKDPDRPVMIEEGAEWEVHVKTRGHRKLQNADKHEELIRVKREEARLRKLAKEAVTEGHS